MNIRQELGIHGGLIFLTVSLGFGIGKGIVAYENYQTTQQNAYAISVLEQVKESIQPNNCFWKDTFGKDYEPCPANKNDDDIKNAAAINARVSEIEKQYGGLQALPCTTQDGLVPCQ